MRYSSTEARGILVGQYCAMGIFTMILSRLSVPILKYFFLKKTDLWNILHKIELIRVPSQCSESSLLVSHVLALSP